MKQLPFKSILILFFLLSLTGFDSHAQNSVKDLVGARASSLDGEMRRHGYVHINSQKTRDGIYSNWWKGSKNKCVTVRVLDGHVEAVTNTLPADCNRNSYSSGNNYNHNNDHNNNYNRNYTGDPKIGDLKGWTAERAYREIRNRGYYHVKDYRNNGKLVKVWYNSKYKKCKKTAEKNGNIDLVDNSKQCGK